VPGFVRLQDVSLRYNDEETALALHRTSFEVEQGEFVAVVGPSGCGKIHVDESRDRTLARDSRAGQCWRQAGGRAAEYRRNGFSEFLAAAVAYNIAERDAPLEIVEPHASRLRRERRAYEAKARDLLELVGLKGYEGQASVATVGRDATTHAALSCANS
jgi:NitT/TauT family transport system ATP-binding protein